MTKHILPSELLRLTVVLYDARTDGDQSGHSAASARLLMPSSDVARDCR